MNNPIANFIRSGGNSLAGLSTIRGVEKNTADSNQRLQQQPLRTPNKVASTTPTLNPSRHIRRMVI